MLQLVGVMLRCEPTESRLDGPLVGQRRDSQNTIKVPLLADLEECLVQSVEEIAGYYQDEYAPPVPFVAGRRRLGSRLTSTDGEAIIDAL